MSEKDLYAIIEKYLEGKLQGEELLAFEERIRNEAGLSEKITAHKEIIEKLKFYGKRRALKKQLDSFHREMPSHEIAPKRKRRFLRLDLYTISIAASVAAITIIATLFTINYRSASDKYEMANYEILSKDVKRIEAEQKQIMGNINEDKKVPIDNGRFTGTGFILSPKGYIVTSYHLVKNADSIFVENEKLGRIKVSKVYSDKVHDLAILKVEDENFKRLGKLPYMFRNRNSEPGEKVFTLGYPREDIVYGEGSISSVSGFEGDTTAYQISIPVNPGNSGGPLVDEQGNLVGMISGKHTKAEGATFAVKSKYVKDFVKSIPKDSISPVIMLPKNNSLINLKRAQQVAKLKDFIFNVRVYNSK